jgi:hypothetical protein
MTAADVHAGLVRYIFSEHLYFTEVRDRCGWDGGKCYADALALCVYPSRGHYLHGVEVKVARSDWLRELKTPAKSHTVFTRCAYWSVAAPAGVVEKDEVPPKWGHFEVSETGVKTRKRPMLLEGAELDSFVVSLLRNQAKERDAMVKAGVGKALAAHAREEAKSKQDAWSMADKANREMAALQCKVKVVDFFEQLAEDLGLGSYEVSYHGHSIRQRIKRAMALEEMIGQVGITASVIDNLVARANKLKDALTDYQGSTDVGPE